MSSSLVDRLDETLRPIPDLEWDQTAKLPFGRGGVASGIIENKLIVAGGSYWRDGVKSLLSEVLAYDLQAKVWKTLPALPRPTFGSAAAGWRDSFFLVGGTERNRTGDMIYRLSLANGHSGWTPWLRLPMPLSHCAAVTVGDRLVVMGGVSDGLQFRDYRAEVWSLNLKDPAPCWEALPSIPDGPRALFASVVVNGRVLLFGGCAADSAKGVVNLTSAFAMEPLERAWTELPAVPTATRAWGATAWADRYVFLFGGYSTQFDAGVLCYDTVLAEYSQAQPLPVPIADIAFEGAANEVYGIGGEPGARMRSSMLLVGRIHTSPRLA